MPGTITALFSPLIRLRITLSIVIFSTLRPFSWPGLHYVLIRNAQQCRPSAARHCQAHFGRLHPTIPRTEVGISELVFAEAERAVRLGLLDPPPAILFHDVLRHVVTNSIHLHCPFFRQPTGTTVSCVSNYFRVGLLLTC